jgi:hypothetical protein
MTDENFENLAIQWPELMEKANIDYIEAGDGWYDLIDTLFSLISKDVVKHKKQLRWIEQQDIPNKEFRIAELEEKILFSIENLPVIEQIKEKFGALRFYCYNSTSDVDLYIGFAERMSYKICETCGNSGKLRTGSWLKVLCDEHDRQRTPSIKD